MCTTPHTDTYTFMHSSMYVHIYTHSHLYTHVHTGGTSPMSPFFKDTIAALLHCAQRHTHHEHSKVQISAFEAINDLVRAASRDTLDVVAQLIGVRCVCMCVCACVLLLHIFTHTTQKDRLVRLYVRVNTSAWHTSNYTKVALL